MQIEKEGEQGFSPKKRSGGFFYYYFFSYSARLACFFCFLSYSLGFPIKARLPENSHHVSCAVSVAIQHLVAILARVNISWRQRRRKGEGVTPMGAQ